MALFRETADVSVRPAVPGTRWPCPPSSSPRGTRPRRRRRRGRARRAASGGPRGALGDGDHPAPRPGLPRAGGVRGGEGGRLAAVAPVPVPQGSRSTPGRRAARPRGRARVADATGHGSRLLAAVVDGLRQDGADHVIAWVLDGDTARAQFLRSAGLGPDGAARELASGPTAARTPPRGPPRSSGRSPSAAGPRRSDVPRREPHRDRCRPAGWPMRARAGPAGPTVPCGGPPHASRRRRAASRSAARARLRSPAAS